MRRLIGVMASEGGAVREFFRALGMGNPGGCPLTALAKSATKPSAEWLAMAERIKNQHGYDFDLVYRNTRNQQVASASSGREPCVLLLLDDGSLSMIADWNDLEVAGGDVQAFERILLSKLLMY